MPQKGLNNLLTEGAEATNQRSFWLRAHAHRSASHFLQRCLCDVSWKAARPSFKCKMSDLDKEVELQQEIIYGTHCLLFLKFQIIATFISYAVKDYLFWFYIHQRLYFACNYSSSGGLPENRVRWWSVCVTHSSKSQINRQCAHFFTLALG